MLGSKCQDYARHFVPAQYNPFESPDPLEIWAKIVESKEMVISMLSGSPETLWNWLVGELK